MSKEPEVIITQGDFSVINRSWGRQELHYKGKKIAEVNYGDYTEQHQTLDKWIKKVRKRDLKRLNMIEHQMSLLLKEKNSLLNTWRDVNEITTTVHT